MQKVKIKSIKKISTQDRYDLTVSSTNNFFANGILIHNTSAISSYILCNKQLTRKDKIAKFFGANVKDTEYDYVYSSRQVVKNQYINQGVNHFYSENIWKTGHDELEGFLEKGMTIYYEIVGFLKDGGHIQKKFDYACKPNQHDKYIYRITSTNEDGKVFEYSMKQVQDFCKLRGLQAVPLHYYGTVKNYIGQSAGEGVLDHNSNWQEQFLKLLTEDFLEKDCKICNNKVPAEGVCIRREVNDIDVYKLKSSAFRLFETKQLDAGEVDIEEIGEEI